MNDVGGFKIDYMNISIIISILLLAFGLIPIIIKITTNKSANDISIGTPIMFIISFIILSIASYIKQSYTSLFIFSFGVIISLVLLVQKILFDKSKDDENNNKNKKGELSGFHFPEV